MRSEGMIHDLTRRLWCLDQASIERHWINTKLTWYCLTGLKYTEILVGRLEQRCGLVGFPYDTFERQFCCSVTAFKAVAEIANTEVGRATPTEPSHNITHNLDHKCLHLFNHSS